MKRAKLGGFWRTPGGRKAYYIADIEKKRRVKIEHRETTLHKLESYVIRYGPEAGPKLYHAVQSRAAYIGASARRARIIEELTGKATRVRRRADTATPLFPEDATTPN